MQISSAGGALCLPADKKILGDFFIAFVADVHVHKIRAMPNICQEAFGAIQEG